MRKVVIPKIENHWVALGHTLGIDQAQLDKINEQYGKYLENCCAETIEYWLINDDIGFKSKIWPVLLQAIANTNPPELVAAADSIKEELIKQNPQ